MNMGTFNASVAAWRRAAFPVGSKNDELDEIHADLALIDTWVAGSVLPYVDTDVWEPAVPNVLGALDSLERHVHGVHLDGENHVQVANRYLAYAGLLRSVYEEFLQVGDRP